MFRSSHLFGTYQEHTLTVVHRAEVYIIKAMVQVSLVPRPHPLTRRNGLVNQVEFLGLVDALATVLPSNVQNILQKTRSKKVRILL